jgi:hypothetical protein
MKLIKALLTTAVILAASLAAPHARGGVVFTNLVFFTYTNAPNYGWNFETPNGRTGALVQGNDGNFYGTTYEGGLNYFALGPPDQLDTYGCGTVFKMSPDGAFTSLYSFGGVNIPGGNADADGRGLVGNLIKGTDGNLVWHHRTWWWGAIRFQWHDIPNNNIRRADIPLFVWQSGLQQ